MLKFYAERYCQLSQSIEGLIADTRDAFNNQTKEIPENLLLKLETYLTDFETLNLTCSIAEVKRMIHSVKNDASNYSNLRMNHSLQELIVRMFDELEGLSFYWILPHKVKFYEETYPFGVEVSTNFSSANFDVEEAGKCFATARYTACVMHLQRALEIGFKSYAVLLGISFPNPQPSWQDIINKTAKEIKDRTDRNNTTTFWVSNEEKEFCEKVQPFLVSVKDAWRNPSMHADSKYTEEEAKEILDAVKAFMRNLAKHLDEQSTFTA